MSEQTNKQSGVLVVNGATFTLKYDVLPEKVYIKKPRGTMYWGGAGLDGPYIQPQVRAFASVGIKNIVVGGDNYGSDSWAITKLGQTGRDAFMARSWDRTEGHGDFSITSGLDHKSGQFNLIGYSYGSLLAAQTANYYAKQGHVVDHLVLIGSPIAIRFLKKLQAHENIKKVVIINLTDKGDPIFAGMSRLHLDFVSLTLVNQFVSGKAEGHFYYAQVVPDSPRRWKELAQRIFNEGVR